MATQTKPKRPRALRKGDKVRVIGGIATFKEGVIEKINKEHPAGMFYVNSPREYDEDMKVMGRFNASQLERVE